MIQSFAFAYTAIILGVVALQVALIAGAPWGRLTQGGLYEGALPTWGRAAAGVSIFILIALALSVLSQAGVGPLWPRWTAWAALAIQAMVTTANWATRSKAERRLWAPITSVMLALMLAVMFRA